MEITENEFNRKYVITVAIVIEKIYYHMNMNRIVSYVDSI